MCTHLPWHHTVAPLCGRRYNRMNKPKWTPPKWLFGPAWGVMYAAQSYSGWRVLHQVPLPGRQSCCLATTAPRLTTGMRILGPPEMHGWKTTVFEQNWCILLSVRDLHV